MGASPHTMEVPPTRPPPAPYLTAASSQYCMDHPSQPLKPFNSAADPHITTVSNAPPKPVPNSDFQRVSLVEEYTAFKPQACLDRGHSPIEVSPPLQVDLPDNPVDQANTIRWTSYPPLQATRTLGESVETFVHPNLPPCPPSFSFLQTAHDFSVCVDHHQSCNQC